MAIEVWTADDLDNVRNNLSGSYIQMADIDLSSFANWVPIGLTAFGPPFLGTYNGNGKKITNLTINDSGLTYAGLFGETSGATIKKLGVYGSVNAGEIAGLLIGNAAGDTNVEECFAAGTVTITGSIAGVLGGQNGNYVNCYAIGTAQTNPASGNWIGGLVGIPDSLENCYAVCTIIGLDFLGGLAGQGPAATSSYHNGPDNGTGTLKTTNQLKQQATFVDWDFTNTWGILPSVNDGYPYLQALTPIPLPEDTKTTVSTFSVKSVNPVITFFTPSPVGNRNWLLHFRVKSFADEAGTVEIDSLDTTTLDRLKFNMSYGMGAGWNPFPSDGLPPSRYGQLVRCNVKVAPGKKAYIRIDVGADPA